MYGVAAESNVQIPYSSRLMSFQQKKIRHGAIKTRLPDEPKQKENSMLQKIKAKYRTRSLSLILGAVMIIGGSYFVVSFTRTLYTYLSNFEVKELVFMWATELKKSPQNYTNILIAGAGGQEHESPDLTDSIMVASIDEDSNIISMISIPRDLYFLDQQSRINKLYYTAKNKFINKFDREEAEASHLAMNSLKEQVGDLLGIEIQYYIKTDFEAFRDIVDALDGINVDVKEDINDPYYPDEKTVGYSPFNIKKGIQHLDGKTALKYVRSRKTTSDYDRSQRQRQVILAIKDAAMSKEVLTSPNKIKELYDSVRNNVETDFNITELIRLAEIGTTFQTDRLISFGLHDDPLNPGGFLYTPPREQFEGAFVLIPYKDEYIKDFASMIFNHRLLYIDKPEIVVLNGTSYSGLATNIFYYLQRFGLNTIDATNTIEKENFAKNTIYYPESNDEAASAIFSLIKDDWTMIPCIKNTEKAENFEENPYCEEFKNKVIIIAGEDFDKKSVALSSGGR